MKDSKHLPAMKAKVVLVTGGAKGIGRAISLKFAGEGASIIVLYNNSLDEAVSLQKDFYANDVPHLFLRADLRDEQQIKSAIKKAAEQFGRIDVLVNNAGVFGLSLQEELSAEDWDEVFGLNMKGLFLVTRESLKWMPDAGSNIVNISSINALHPGFGLTAHYDASKGAVSAYTRSLAAELAPKGIRVNAVAPGLVDSEGLRLSAPELAAKTREATPLKKLVRTADVADSVYFLASEAASMITGITLTVDGGYLLR